MDYGEIKKAQKSRRKKRLRRERKCIRRKMHNGVDKM